MKRAPGQPLTPWQEPRKSRLVETSWREPSGPARVPLGVILPDSGLCAWQLYFSWHLSDLASGRGVCECEVPGREEGREVPAVFRRYARAAAAGTGRWGAHRRESEHRGLCARARGTLICASVLCLPRQHSLVGLLFCRGFARAFPSVVLSSEARARVMGRRPRTRAASEEVTPERPHQAGAHNFRVPRTSRG